MTSPLRKNRQTTALPTTATNRKLLQRLVHGALALVVCTGLGGMGLGSVTADEVPLQHAPQVAKPQLKWRPARPAMAQQQGTPGQITPTVLPQQDLAVRQVANTEAIDGPMIAPAQLLLSSGGSSSNVSTLPRQPSQSSQFAQVPPPEQPGLTFPGLDSTPPAPKAPELPMQNPGLQPLDPQPAAPIPPPAFNTVPEPAMPMPMPMTPGNTTREPAQLPAPMQDPPAAPSKAGSDTKSKSSQDNMNTDCENARNKSQNVRISSSLGTQILNLTSSKTGDMPFECTLTGTDFSARNWNCITYTWKASALCHKPLYFEQVSMERYGHSWGPVIDPVVSAAHFFGTLPILPYKMGVDTPCECEYALGYYRPGNCAPFMIEPFPISARGALFEAGAVVGAAAVLP